MVLLAVVQVLIAGMRWQMIPAYALCAVFLLLSRWINRPATAVTAPQSLLARLTAGLGFGIVGIALALAIALPMITPVFHFPKPTGPYAIGTVTYHWIDKDRPEIFTSAPDAHREVMVQVWYPTRTNFGGGRAPYEQGLDFSRTATLLGHLPTFFFDHLKYVTTNARLSTPMTGEQSRFPVVIFSPGRGGYRSVNTFQVEVLVSDGYVVVGIDHPYTVADVAFPDGRHALLDRRVATFKVDGHDGEWNVSGGCR